MKTGDFIKIGDRVRLALGGRHYSTIVEGFYEDDGVYLSPPLARQRTIIPGQGETCLLISTCKMGIIAFRLRIDGVDYGDNIPLIRAQVVSGPEKIQRRGSYRADLMLDVTIRKHGRPEKTGEQEPPFETKTVNVSEKGMLFVSDGRYHIGEKLSCDLVLNKFDMNARLEDVKAVVVRREDTPDGRHRTAAQFTHYPGKSRDILLRFIFLSQRKNNSRE